MPPPPLIFTLTGNLLAERTLEFECWTPGRTQRALRESFQVGGKGINVSRMLSRLGTPGTALCFAGGATGAECAAWLRERGFDHRAFATGTPTRAGTVVRDRGGVHPETTFLGPDAPADGAAVQECADFLDTQPAGHVLALCGSVPGWTAPHYDALRGAIVRWSERGMLVADTYGAPLRWIRGLNRALIKVNREEFRTLAGDGDIRALLETAAGAWPRTRWIVTDGPREIWFVEPGGSAASLAPPPVQEVSATGSGDVFLAGVIHALYVRQLTLGAAVAFAMPFAAANAAHPGVAEFPLPPVRA